MSTAAERYFALLTALIDVAGNALDPFQRSQDPRRDIVLVLLHGRILELAKAIVTLSQAHCWTAVPVVLRSMLELRILQRNVLKDPKTVDEMQLKNIKVAIKAKNAADAGNVVLKSIFADLTESQIADRIDPVTHKKLIDAGVEDPHISTLFERVGELDYYKSVYAFLCGDTHGQLSALVGKHLDPKEGALIFFSEESLSENAAFVYETTHIALSSTVELFQYFETELPDPLAALQYEFKVSGEY